SGVAKIPKKNSMHKALALIGSKKADVALAAEDKAKTTATVDVAAKEKALKNSKRKATAVTKRERPWHLPRLKLGLSLGRRVRQGVRNARRRRLLNVAMKRKGKKKPGTRQQRSQRLPRPRSARQSPCKQARPDPKRKVRLQIRLLSKP
ncbi:unnamed protein product, partial [Scytosiphon promiscuus]